MGLGFLATRMLWQKQIVEGKSPRCAASDPAGEAPDGGEGRAATVVQWPKRVPLAGPAASDAAVTVVTGNAARSRTRARTALRSFAVAIFGHPKSPSGFRQGSTLDDARASSAPVSCF